MTERQVSDRMGKPEDQAVSGRNKTWGYVVKAPRGYDAGYLSIDFGSNGQVEKIWRTGRADFLNGE